MVPLYQAFGEENILKQKIAEQELMSLRAFKDQGLLIQPTVENSSMGGSKAPS